ncbi:Basic blue protein [Euphorbia peplus]|nr:Basic blue protein [Euphorbia peplus]
MGQGRGSATTKLALLNLAAMLLLLANLNQQVHAATFTVGGSSGWTFNVASWPKGKSFKAGDTLVFNYDSTTHNVVAVNKSSYSNCSAPAGAKLFKSGKDQIKLAKGLNFFICGIPGHCQSGMKIAVNAA